jgi:hypothetical protein
VQIKPKPVEFGANNDTAPAAQAVKESQPPDPAPAPAPRNDVALQVHIRTQQQPPAITLPALPPAAHEEPAHAAKTAPGVSKPVPVTSTRAAAAVPAPVERTESAPARRPATQTKIQQTTAVEPETDDENAATDAAPVRAPAPVQGIRATASNVPETTSNVPETISNAPETRAPEAMHAHTELPYVPESAAPAQAVPIAAAVPANAEINVAPPQLTTSPRLPQIPQASHAALQEPVPPPAAATQPVRSLALEFTPDGAGDVRLRLSERAGEVHISLHSSDSSLAGRLHEGVHDLVGSLSKAGYDAEAWTPSQGRQNNQRDPETPTPRKTRSDGSSASGADDFDNILQQPIQEVS